jgi:hypothetical protein
LNDRQFHGKHSSLRNLGVLCVSAVSASTPTLTAETQGTLS